MLDGFPGAVGIKYYKLSGLKQQKFILSKFKSLEAQTKGNSRAMVPLRLW